MILVLVADEDRVHRRKRLEDDASRRIDHRTGVAGAELVGQQRVHENAAARGLEQPPW